MKKFSLLSIVLCTALILASPVMALDTTPGGLRPMGADVFGTTFVDSDSDRDPIKYALPLGDFALIAVIEKNGERGAADLERTTNAHNTYSLAGIYKMPLGVAGLRLNMETHQTLDALNQKGFFINPFWKFSFNNIKVQGGLRYQWGDISLSDDPNTTLDGASTSRMDIARFAANLGLHTSLGPIKLEVGYTHMFGKSDGITDNEQAGLWNGFGDDWDKVWILAANEEEGYASLGGGGLGKLLLSPMGAATFQAGAKLAYIKGEVSPIENMNVSLLFASSIAEDTPAGWSDKQGMEWDVKVSYSFLDNLSYTFIAAYLAADDFWKKGDADLDPESIYSVFSQLKLKF